MLYLVLTNILYIFLYVKCIFLCKPVFRAKKYVIEEKGYVNYKNGDFSAHS